MTASISQKESQMNEMNIPQLLKLSLILTLLLLALLTSSLMTTRAAVEPLKTIETDEATDGPMTWSSPPEPEFFDDLTAPLSGLSDSARHTPSADAENVEFVGHIGGPTYAVAVQGNHAYIGEGYFLTTLDVSNPAAPTLLGKTDSFPAMVRAVYVYGDHAYVVDYGDGLRVVDVSDPAHPAQVGSFETLDGALGVYVSGAAAYVVGDSGFQYYDAWLQVVDVSNPAHPTEVGHYDTLQYADDVYVSGSIAYVADRYNGLRLVDVSDPAHPTEIGYYDTPRAAHGVYVSGDYAYVATGSGAYGGLLLLDVSDPAHPSEVGY
jgi:hypothetical protein